MLYALVLNSLISSIRDINFNNALTEINRRVKKKKKGNNNKIQQKLDMLFMRNDGNVSILYNLSYLDTLAESFNYRKVARICKIQKSKYINRIVDTLLVLNN